MATPPKNIGKMPQNLLRKLFWKINLIKMMKILICEKPFYFVYQSKYDFKMYDVFHFRRVLNPFSGIVPKRQISLTMLFVLLGCLLMLAGWLTSISKEFSLGWFESKFNRFSFEEMRGKRCISKFSNASLY